MNDPEVKQEGNLVLGDQAAGSIDKSTRSYNFPKPQQSASTMARLLKRFEYERTNNITLKGYIEELNHYYSPVEGDVIGLEQKLKDGKAENFLKFALSTKERFYKRLTKFELYESAQKINAHLLALVITYFELQIAPRIRQGLKEDELGTVIKEFIIEPLLREVEDNSLGFDAEDIAGMLFFLTGNCHLTWK
ncbi:MAG TPA: ABC-three component system protein [Pyrinomonadaceae bacterium]|jgi:hypothetical protein|nr:ABC-three component system protein [Pyrinomonadaceae bacterium]